MKRSQCPPSRTLAQINCPDARSGRRRMGQGEGGREVVSRGMGTYSSAAHCVGMREAGEESNKVKIINLFHASKSQQNSRRRRREKESEGEREQERLCVSERWVRTRQRLNYVRKGCSSWWCVVAASSSCGWEWPQDCPAGVMSMLSNLKLSCD